VKVISPDRALELPPILEGDKCEAQIVQLETIRLNGQCAADILKTLLDLVYKLSDDARHLKNDNSSRNLELKKLKELMSTRPVNADHATAGSLSSQPVPKNVPREHPVSSAAFPVISSCCQ
jgi:hypothetical protein